MKSHLCDVAKHERDKLTVTESVLLTMAPATPSLQISKLNQAQFEEPHAGKACGSGLEQYYKCH
jgi:hypothetical protein